MFDFFCFVEIGKHVHDYSGTVAFESGHTHTKGTMNITGTMVGMSGLYGRTSTSGAFTAVRDYAGVSHNWVGGWAPTTFTFDASRSWTGSTSSGSAHNHSYSGTTDKDSGEFSSEGEPQPRHVVLVPIIKY